MTTVLTQSHFDCGMQIIAQIKVKFFFLLSHDEHYPLLPIFFQMSFNLYVYGVPVGVFMCRSCTLY